MDEKKILGWKPRRLTKAMRERIEGRLKSALIKANTEPGERETALARRIYRLFVPEHVEAKMKRLPGGFFVESTQVLVRTRGNNRRGIHLAEGAVLAPAMYGGRYDGSFDVYSEDLPDDVLDSMDLLFSAQEDFKKCVKEIVGNISGVVNHATTEKKLLELWPEAIDYLDPPPVPVSDNLPAVKVAETQDLINQLLGGTGDGGEQS